MREVPRSASSARSAEQTEVARFWDYSQPAIYFGVARTVAQQPGRDLAANLLLHGFDDALISMAYIDTHGHGIEI